MFVKEIDAPTLHAQLTSGTHVELFDVRSPAEMVRGTLPRAEQLPLHLLPLRLQDIPKDKPVVFYCRSGARSAQACSYLMAQGYTNVINLRGGVIAWVRHDLPLIETTIQA